MVEGVSGWPGLVGWFAGIVEGVAAKVLSAIASKACAWVISRAWYPLKNKISRHRGKRYVPVRAQLKKCITSKLDALESADLVSAVFETQAIQQVADTVFLIDDLCWQSRFFWSRLLDGRFPFVEDACREVREWVIRNRADVGFSLQKNQIFSQSAALGSLRERRVITGRYSDSKDWLHAESAAVSDAKVVVFETTIYSNRIVAKALDYLRIQHAKPIGVWVLFDARCEGDRLADIEGVPVNAAYRIDLGLIEIDNVGNRKIKTLRYDEQ